MASRGYARITVPIITRRSSSIRTAIALRRIAAVPARKAATMQNDSMLAALHAAEPDPALADKLRLYGQFVGSWRVEVESRPLGDGTQRAQAEWHFGWV